MFKLNVSMILVSALSAFMLQTSFAAPTSIDHKNTKEAKETKETKEAKNKKSGKEVSKVAIAAKKSRHITYRVFGKKYIVLANSTNYVKKGIASWYGGSFHGRHTSSGEHYNMYAMTAAHKTLPLSTMVLVTNLKNGKQVVVKINDRGPFVSNRLIDLSYGAAKKLGMVHAGLAMVRVKVMEV